MSLTIDDASNFLPSGHHLPSDRSVAPNSMLTQFDRLCESLGGTLREVVIALVRPHRDDSNALANPAEMIRRLPEQMPNMVRRRRLLIRMSQNTRKEFVNDYNMHNTALQSVFERGGRYWVDIAHNDQWLLDT